MYAQSVPLRLDANFRVEEKRAFEKEKPEGTDKKINGREYAL